MSNRIGILNLTSQKQLSPEQIINHVVDAFWHQFPNRILAAFSTGSYSGGYAVAGSDLDLIFIFSEGVTETEKTEGIHLIDKLNRIAPLELDIGLLSETEKVRPALKFDSTLIRGKDVRDHLQVMDVSYWIRERMHAGCWLICHLFNRNSVAEIPFSFPNPQVEFLGYNTNRGGASDGPEGSTKDLIRSTSWAATALVGCESGDYVTSKKHLLSILDLHLPKEWATFLKELLSFCRIQTNYGIPTEPDGRLKLRELCYRTREFEEYFLEKYKGFLLGELTTDIQRITVALDRINETPFRDRDIRDKIVNSDWQEESLRNLRLQALLAIA